MINYKCLQEKAMLLNWIYAIIYLNKIIYNIYMIQKLISIYNHKSKCYSIVNLPTI